MAVAAQFMCPDDQHEFNVLWTFMPRPKPVTCPKCGKTWETELLLDQENRVAGARITVAAPDQQGGV